MKSIGSPHGRPVGRRRLALAAAVTGLACLIVGVGIYASTIVREPMAGTGSPAPSGGTAGASPSIGVGTGVGYLVAAEELRQRAEIARDGREPHRAAVEDLLAEADEALGRVPRPRNPLSARNGRFLADTHDAYTLALAWMVSGDERYARLAAQFIMAWVEEVHETSDTCSDSGSRDCATSLLVSRSAPGFVFAADLLRGSSVLSAGDEDRLRRWLAELILPAASERTNNWGDAGTFMRLAVADYIGDHDAFAAAVERWRALMDLVTAEGQIPEETRRGSLGLLYSQGAISYKVGGAVIAERRGVDLWSYEGKGGGTLRRAIDSIARYWQDPQSWPWHDGRLEIPSVDPAWELIYQRWPEPAYARILAPKRPLGTTNPSAIVWTTLTHGEPLPDDSAWEPRRPTASRASTILERRGRSLSERGQRG